jgi:DNA replication and repair protein RecF
MHYNTPLKKFLRDHGNSLNISAANRYNFGCKMIIKDIKIDKFRNLHDFSISLSGDVNLFYGENGHGKTNLLESVAFLINGRTQRAGRIYEIIPHDLNFAKWNLSADIENVFYNIECVIETSQVKKLTVNGQMGKKLPGCDRGAYALTFFPEDFEILTGEPSFRRRFLDEAIILTEPSYIRILKTYKDAYLARNTMLKSRDINPSSFRPYEEILAKAGFEITQRRSKVLGEIQSELDIISSSTFDGEISFSLQYLPSLNEWCKGSDPEKDIINAFEKTRDRDIAIKRTMIGPHRDDFTARFDDEDIRRFSSRGETRLSLVILIIAKYYILKKRWNLEPVILLDDIFSELDHTRRKKVLQALPASCQLMITAVDKDLSRQWLEDMDKISMFNVCMGKITAD